MKEHGTEDYRDMEEKFSAAGEDHRRIPVPEEMRARVEAGIARAQREKEKNKTAQKTGGSDMSNQRNGKVTGAKGAKRRRTGFRIGAAAAAAAAMLVILPNTGAGVAHAMGSLPVVGKLFQAVTFRDYRYESDRFDADVEVPKIQVEDMEDTESQNGEDTSGQLQETVEQINFDIEEVTNRLVEEFKKAADAGESYGSLDIHHETVTDNEQYFTLKLSLYQGAGSGYQSYKFYTIDKKTGKQIQLGDLFTADSSYNETLSENIREQMRARMEEDETKTYWVDYEEVPEWNFEKLKEDQNFYFDESGNLVIVFDEYEVAPGYMGAQEFTVEKDVFEGLLK